MKGAARLFFPQENAVYYLAAAAGAAGVFTVFLTAFLWCFLATAVFAGAEAAGLLVLFVAGAGAGVWADTSDIVARARAMVNTVVFIFFFSCGPFYRPLTILSCGLVPEITIA